jgi:hypothetical protein
VTLSFGTLKHRYMLKASQTFIFTASTLLAAMMIRKFLQPRISMMFFVMTACTVFCFGMAIEKLWKIAGVLAQKIAGYSQTSIDEIQNCALTPGAKNGVDE